MTIDKKRLNEIVPVSHPIFWFGTILAQKSNNKNYSNNSKTNQVELISSCYHYNTDKKSQVKVFT